MAIANEVMKKGWEMMIENGAKELKVEVGRYKVSHMSVKKFAKDNGYIARNNHNGSWSILVNK